MAKKHEKGTILIIEDEAEVRKFAARVLELEGYHVIQAENGEEGLELARQVGISLILLDLRLPGIDGWSVMEHIKRIPEFSAVPIVVFTASAGVPQHDRAREMGAADYLVKPLSAAALKEATAQILKPKE